MNNEIKDSEQLKAQNINDVFDDILFSEEKLIEEGYKEGYTEGQSEDTIEGYHLGYHRGAEIGSELGYYQAFCEHYLEEITKKGIPEKVIKNLETLRDTIQEFPKTNHDQVDLFQLVDKVQGLYKKICVQLKVKSDFKKEGLQF